MSKYLDWTLQNASLALSRFEAENFYAAFNYADLSYRASELYLDVLPLQRLKRKQRKLPYNLALKLVKTKYSNCRFTSQDRS